MNHEQARAAIFRGETVRARFAGEKYVFDYKLVDGKIFWKVHTCYNGNAALRAEWTDSCGDFYSTSTRAAKFTRVVKKNLAPAPTYPRWVKHKELETFYIFSDERQTNAPFVYNGGGEFFYDPVAYTSGIDSMLAAGHTEVLQSEVEAAVGRVTLANLLKGKA